MSELLANHTTLRIGGPAKNFVVATTETEIITAVATADEQGESVLILSGGSNMLVADEEIDATVVQIVSKGVDAVVSKGASAIVDVQAGEVWDEFVAFALNRRWIGVAALSGIPGLVGAAPVQNIGAYGQEVADTISQVRTWDRESRSIRTFGVTECGFGYRDSVFKRTLLSDMPQKGARYVVLAVQFQFQLGDFEPAVRYVELANALGVLVGEQAAGTAVREQVLALRCAKGMVATADDHDSWSAGSFFTNPVIPAEVAGTLPLGAPRFLQPDGTVKTSAAWLIEHAGFEKGFRLPASPAALSRKHVLALTNRGGASAADVLALARVIRDGVRSAYGITLIPEPLLVGLSL
ncbi:MAG: UDP-N-acetylmuramate dehydrogenase [Propionibacteriaceae bacterium]|jgi:UDP-N-acetylmuramate dehydrogenase|nr:UDP-N-acetylmuramate dehydrogenase [Propionibacteriaceae bacterium]